MKIFETSYLGSFFCLKLCKSKLPPLQVCTLYTSLFSIFHQVQNQKPKKRRSSETLHELYIFSFFHFSYKNNFFSLVIIHTSKICCTMLKEIEIKPKETFIPMFEGVSETNTYILNLICIKTAKD